MTQTSASRSEARIPVWRQVAGSRGLQILCALLVLGWLLARGLEAAGGAVALGERLGPKGALVLIPVQALVAFTPALGEMTALANAALYGFWLGAGTSWTAWMLTSWLQYEGVRRTARDFDFAATRAALPGWLRRFPADHPVFLIGVRLPFGGPIVNTAAGALGVGRWRHLWCAALGIAPRALFFAAVGTGLLRA